ncbi:MAG: F0F1 ATP synthase subunit delta [Eubacterium sp.]|nr:F0F1 ATP synthase subunit delta [Eubacterium sp.]
MEEFVCKEEKAGSAKIEIVKDESLIGGFIIRIGNKQFDRS